MNRVIRIMVIEDSETQAFKMRTLLEKQGWEVTAAGAAEAALAALAPPLPDLIMVDYNLPGVRGDEFCRRIRMNMNTRGIPILMMTASAPDGTEIISLESGADDYIAKSEGPEVLLSRIRALLRKEPAPAAILDPQDSAFRNARILTIDDGLAYVEFLTDDLRKQGYEVDSAASGPEGLALLETQNFDCVLVDLRMPGMDGIEVCRRIAAKRADLKSALAVIMLTASQEPGDMDRGLEAGADDFVRKSGDLSILRARIQALMRRRFFQEESGRIVGELKARELETSEAQAGRQIAEDRAAISEKLVQVNIDLREANRKLKEAQAQLIQTEKMASLGQLVAGIAHEVNNPLAFVLNNLFIVQHELDALAPAMAKVLTPPSLLKLGKVRARLGEMQAGLDRVKELVAGLRTFSRLDEGVLTAIDVVTTIDEVLLLLKHRMNGRIRVEKCYVPGRMLSCYPGRLKQVLMNLISNAVDAIAGDGTIFIATSQTAEAFLISVRDTGAGIAEAVRNKIFDPFFTTKPVGQGTGLGLAISYGIVQDLGGSITVQSEVGVGTEFVVAIPLDLELRGEDEGKALNPG